jgi:uncharacterized delta-60 repeat protein
MDPMSIGLLAITPWSTLMKQMGAMNSPGTLDPSFGDDGVVTLPLGTPSIAVLPDNKLIAFTGRSLQEPLTVRRLTEKGTPDPTFGNDGVVEVPVRGYLMLANHIEVLQNGNYLLSGYESGVAPTRRYVCRLLEDGQADASFAAAGIATIGIEEITEVVDAVFFAGDLLAVSRLNGKIYVSAHLYSEKRGIEAAVFRLNEDGSRDISFNGGYVLIPIMEGGSGIHLTSLVVHGDGVLVGGGFVESNGLRRTAFLNRYEQSGQADISFGDRGTVIIPNGNDGRTSIINSLEVNNSGLIVVAGESGRGAEKEGLIAALNPNGGFNLIFNKGLPLYATFLIDLVFSALVLQERKILVSGSGDSGGYLMAARYELDGSLDPAFGDKGWVVFDQSGTLSALSSQLTGNNKIVVLAGRSLGRYAVRYLG